jgi:hypothetical protein
LRHRGCCFDSLSIATQSVTVLWPQGTQNAYEIGAAHSNLAELAFFNPIDIYCTIAFILRSLRQCFPASNEATEPDSDIVTSFIIDIASNFIQVTLGKQFVHSID